MGSSNSALTIGAFVVGGEHVYTSVLATTCDYAAKLEPLLPIFNNIAATYNQDIDRDVIEVYVGSYYILDRATGEADFMYAPFASFVMPFGDIIFDKEFTERWSI